MSKYNQKNLYNEKTFIEQFLSTLVKLGNVIIICLGIVIFGVKKLIFITNKEKNSQSLIEFTENLEKRLNFNSTQSILRKQNRSFSNRAIRFNKSNNKFLNKKNILYVSAGICVITVFTLIGIFVINDDKDKSVTSESVSFVDTSQILLNIMKKENIYTLKEKNIINGPNLSLLSYENKNKWIEEQLNKFDSDAVASTNTSISTETSTNEIDLQILIHLNDINDEVAKIQEYLMDLHYMDQDEPTTDYGAVTHYAMQLFQRGHGLSVDGIAGFDTLNLLYSDDAKPYTVRKGDKGTDIAKIKERLKELDYLSSSNENSRFDDDTDMAIRNFQGRNKLSQDGIVGYNTTQVLFNGDAKPAKSSSLNDSSSSDNSSSENSNISYDASSASKLVSFAKSLLNQGIPYVWGGKTRAGLDCSGFVYYSLNNSGYKIRYMTSAGWAKSSYKTINSMSDLKPGDIVTFSGHVGIYIGDGKMIDSSSSENDIRITNFKNSAYWNRKWLYGKRVFS